MFMLCDLPIHTAIIGGILGFVFFLFAALFFFPAIKQIWKFGRYTKQHEEIDKADLDTLPELFSRDIILDHLGKEFSYTLHEQKDLDASGTYHTTAIRQTVPAEMYFSGHGMQGRDLADG